MKVFMIVVFESDKIREMGTYSVCAYLLSDESLTSERIYMKAPYL